jgi:hypothetical protein
MESLALLFRVLSKCKQQTGRRNLHNHIYIDYAVELFSDATECCSMFDQIER